MIFPSNEAGGLHRGIPDFNQICPAGIIGLRFREHQLEEAEDDRQVIAQRVHGDTVERHGRGRFVHGQIMGGMPPGVCRKRAGTM
jgi:hypothetical protein